MRSALKNIISFAINKYTDLIYFSAVLYIKHQICIYNVLCSQDGGKKELLSLEMVSESFKEVVIYKLGWIFFLLLRLVIL